MSNTNTNATAMLLAETRRLHQRVDELTLAYKQALEAHQTQAPAHEPLTKEEIKEGLSKYEPDEAPEPWAFRMGVEWAEAKHGIKKGKP